MDTQILGLLVFLTVVQLSKSQVELEIHPPGQIKQGDTVRFICKITDPTFLNLNRISRMIDGNHRSITSNNQLVIPFDTNGRYSTAVSDNVQEQSEVVITGITGADAGRIACSKVPVEEDLDEAIEHIHVSVPPTKVELVYDGRVVQNGETVSITEGDTANYQCRIAVDGDDRSPHVTVNLDGKDITKKMGVEQVPIMSSANGLLDNKFSATYSKSSRSPQLASREYHGKTLTCTATTEGFDPLSANFNIEYRYAPKTDQCQPSQHYTVGGSMVISCTSSMYPKPLTASWMWDDGHLEITSPSASEGRYTATVEEDEAAQEYTYTLTLKDVTAEDDLDSQVYTLSMNNGVDNVDFNIHVENTHDVTTSLAPPPVVTDSNTGVTPDSGNSSSAASLSISLVFIVSLLALSFC